MLLKLYCLSFRFDTVSAEDATEFDKVSAVNSFEVDTGSAEVVIKVDTVLAEDVIEVNTVSSGDAIEFNTVSPEDAVEVDTASAEDVIEVDTVSAEDVIEVDTASSEDVNAIEVDTASAVHAFEVDIVSAEVIIKVDTVSVENAIEIDTVSAEDAIEVDAVSSEDTIGVDTVSVEDVIEVDTVSFEDATEVDTVSSEDAIEEIDDFIAVAPVEDGYNISVESAFEGVDTISNEVSIEKGNVVTAETAVEEVTLTAETVLVKANNAIEVDTASAEAVVEEYSFPAAVEEVDAVSAETAVEEVHTIIIEAAAEEEHTVSAEAAIEIDALPEEVIEEDSTATSEAVASNIDGVITDSIIETDTLFDVLDTDIGETVIEEIDAVFTEVLSKENNTVSSEVDSEDIDAVLIEATLKDVDTVTSETVLKEVDTFVIEAVIEEVDAAFSYTSEGVVEKVHAVSIEDVVEQVHSFSTEDVVETDAGSTKTAFDASFMKADFVDYDLTRVHVSKVSIEIGGKEPEPVFEEGSTISVGDGIDVFATLSNKASESGNKAAIVEIPESPGITSDDILSSKTFVEASDIVLTEFSDSDTNAILKGAKNLLVETKTVLEIKPIPTDSVIKAVDVSEGLAEDIGTIIGMQENNKINVDEFAEHHQDVLKDVIDTTNLPASLQDPMNANVEDAMIRKIRSRRSTDEKIVQEVLVEEMAEDLCSFKIFIQNTENRYYAFEVDENNTRHFNEFSEVLHYLDDEIGSQGECKEVHIIRGGGMGESSYHVAISKSSAALYDCKVVDMKKVVRKTQASTSLFKQNYDEMHLKRGIVPKGVNSGEDNSFISQGKQGASESQKSNLFGGIGFGNSAEGLVKAAAVELDINSQDQLVIRKEKDADTEDGILSTVDDEVDEPKPAHEKESVSLPVSPDMIIPVQDADTSDLDILVDKGSLETKVELNLIKPLGLQVEEGILFDKVDNVIPDVKIPSMHLVGHEVDIGTTGFVETNIDDIEICDFEGLGIDIQNPAIESIDNLEEVVADKIDLEINDICKTKMMNSLPAQDPDSFLEDIQLPGIYNVYLSRVEESPEVLSSEMAVDSSIVLNVLTLSESDVTGLESDKILPRVETAVGIAENPESEIDNNFEDIPKTHSDSDRDVAINDYDFDGDFESFLDSLPTDKVETPLVASEVLFVDHDQFLKNDVDNVITPLLGDLGITIEATSELQGIFEISDEDLSDFVKLVDNENSESLIGTVIQQDTVETSREEKALENVIDKNNIDGAGDMGDVSLEGIVCSYEVNEDIDNEVSDTVKKSTVNQSRYKEQEKLHHGMSHSYQDYYPLKDTEEELSFQGTQARLKELNYYTNLNGDKVFSPDVMIKLVPKQIHISTKDEKIISQETIFEDRNTNRLSDQVEEDMEIVLPYEILGNDEELLSVQETDMSVSDVFTVEDSKEKDTDNDCGKTGEEFKPASIVPAEDDSLKEIHLDDLEYLSQSESELEINNFYDPLGTEVDTIGTLVDDITEVTTEVEEAEATDLQGPIVSIAGEERDFISYNLEYEASIVEVPDVLPEGMGTHLDETFFTSRQMSFGVEPDVYENTYKGIALEDYDLQTNEFSHGLTLDSSLVKTEVTLSEGLSDEQVIPVETFEFDSEISIDGKWLENAKLEIQNKDLSGVSFAEPEEEGIFTSESVELLFSLDSVEEIVITGSSKQEEILDLEPISEEKDKVGEKAFTSETAEPFEEIEAFRVPVIPGTEKEVVSSVPGEEGLGMLEKELVNALEPLEVLISTETSEVMHHDAVEKEIISFEQVELEIFTVEPAIEVLVALESVQEIPKMDEKEIILERAEEEILILDSAKEEAVFSESFFEEKNIFESSIDKTLPLEQVQEIVFSEIGDKEVSNEITGIEIVNFRLQEAEKEMHFLDSAEFKEMHSMEPADEEMLAMEPAEGEEMYDLESAENEELHSLEPAGDDEMIPLPDLESAEYEEKYDLESSEYGEMESTENEELPALELVEPKELSVSKPAEETVTLYSTEGKMFIPDVQKEKRITREASDEVTFSEEITISEELKMHYEIPVETESVPSTMAEEVLTILQEAWVTLEGFVENMTSPQGALEEEMEVTEIKKEEITSLESKVKEIEIEDYVSSAKEVQMVEAELEEELVYELAEDVTPEAETTEFLSTSKPMENIIEKVEVLAFEPEEIAMPENGVEEILAGESVGKAVIPEVKTEEEVPTLEPNVPISEIEMEGPETRVEERVLVSEFVPELEEVQESKFVETVFSSSTEVEEVLLTSEPIEKVIISEVEMGVVSTYDIDEIVVPETGMDEESVTGSVEGVIIEAEIEEVSKLANEIVVPEGEKEETLGPKTVIEEVVSTLESLIKEVVLTPEAVLEEVMAIAEAGVEEVMVTLKTVVEDVMTAPEPMIENILPTSVTAVEEALSDSENSVEEIEETHKAEPKVEEVLGPRTKLEVVSTVPDSVVEEDEPMILSEATVNEISTTRSDVEEVETLSVNTEIFVVSETKVKDDLTPEGIVEDLVISFEGEGEVFTPETVVEYMEIPKSVVKEITLRPENKLNQETMPEEPLEVLQNSITPPDDLISNQISFRESHTSEMASLRNELNEEKLVDPEMQIVEDISAELEMTQVRPVIINQELPVDESVIEQLVESELVQDKSEDFESEVMQAKHVTSDPESMFDEYVVNSDIMQVDVDLTEPEVIKAEPVTESVSRESEVVHEPLMLEPDVMQRKPVILQPDTVQDINANVELGVMQVEPSMTKPELMGVKPEIVHEVHAKAELQDESLMGEPEQLQVEPSMVGPEQLQIKPLIELEQLQVEPSMVEPEQLQVKPSMVKPEQMQVEPSVVELEQMQVEPSKLEPEQVEPSMVEPEQLQVEPSVIDPEQLQVEPSMAESEQLQVEPSMVEPEILQVELSMGEPEQVEPVMVKPELHIEPVMVKPELHIEPVIVEPELHIEPVMVEPEQLQIEPVMVEPELHIEPVMVEPEQLHIEPVMVEPEQVQIEPVIVEPELHIEPVTVEPELHIEPVTVEPEQLQIEPVMVEPEQLQIEPVMVEPEQLQIEPVMVEPEQLQIEPVMIEPEQLLVEPVTVEPEQLQIEPVIVEPELQIEPVMVEPELYIEPVMVESEEQLKAVIVETEQLQLKPVMVESEQLWVGHDFGEPELQVEPYVVKSEVGKESVIEIESEIVLEVYANPELIQGEPVMAETELQNLEIHREPELIQAELAMVEVERSLVESVVMEPELVQIDLGLIPVESEAVDRKSPRPEQGLVQDKTMDLGPKIIQVESLVQPKEAKWKLAETETDMTQVESALIEPVVAEPEQTEMKQKEREPELITDIRTVTVNLEQPNMETVVSEPRVSKIDPVSISKPEAGVETESETESMGAKETILQRMEHVEPLLMEIDQTKKDIASSELELLREKPEPAGALSGPYGEEDVSFKSELESVERDESEDIDLPPSEASSFQSGKGSSVTQGKDVENLTVVPRRGPGDILFSWLDVK
ncbi:titin-like [Penaeus chinensis]|uniref:titin-like n=1 Tax=Penaeus chinensis TaxID=139456 RepID=UPI001FB6DD48|nr:titin-like [Penaeus chinensis]